MTMRNARSTYRTFNAVYCKAGVVISDEVVLHLVKSKCMCMPLFLCGTKAIPLKKAQIKSTEYAVASCFMKRLKTKSKEIISDCMSFLTTHG